MSHHSYEIFTLDRRELKINSERIWTIDKLQTGYLFQENDSDMNAPLLCIIGDAQCHIPEINYYVKLLNVISFVH